MPITPSGKMFLPLFPDRRRIEIGLATQALPASPGVPESAAASTVVVPWNDPEALAEAVARHEFAAIIAEPLPANMGLVPPRDGFLELRGPEPAARSRACCRAGSCRRTCRQHRR